MNDFGARSNWFPRSKECESMALGCRLDNCRCRYWHRFAYVLFGLVWTNWDVITGAQSAPAPKRTGGDPIDNWAKGVVAMMFAFPVVLAGFVAGTIAGFRLGHRRHHVKADHSAVCRLSEGRGDGDAFEDAMRSASHTSKNSGDAGGNSQ